MPIYEYQCDKCSKIYEKIQKFSDPIMSVCEVCGSPVVKLMGKPALQFKGTGFYITDYVRKGNNGEPAGTTSKASSSESSPAPAPAASAPPASTSESSTGETKTA